MRGVALKVIQELMGHATIEMTMRYAHLSPDVAKDAVNVLDEVWNNSGTREGASSQVVGILDRISDPNEI